MTSEDKLTLGLIVALFVTVLLGCAIYAWKEVRIAEAQASAKAVRG